MLCSFLSKYFVQGYIFFSSFKIYLVTGVWTLLLLKVYIFSWLNVRWCNDVDVDVDEVEVDIVEVNLHNIILHLTGSSLARSTTRPISSWSICLWFSVFFGQTWKIPNCINTFFIRQGVSWSNFTWHFHLIEFFGQTPKFKAFDRIIRSTAKIIRSTA